MAAEASAKERHVAVVASLGQNVVREQDSSTIDRGGAVREGLTEVPLGRGDLLQSRI